MATRLPLSDVKVLDFMWVLAGPGITRSMADYGATIIRIESTQRVDPTRTVGPFKDNNTNPEFSALYSNNNAGKLGLSLDLSKPEARAIVLDLVRWADVVSESFSPKAMRNWGFDYESLRAVKPDIIMISSCLMGQTGPLASTAGHDINYIAIAGALDNFRRTGERPLPPLNLVGDMGGGGMLLAFGITSALVHVARTGQGQVIDAAMVDGAALQLATTFGMRAQGRWGGEPGSNFSDTGAPSYEVYECADGKFIAVGAIEGPFWAEVLKLLDLPADSVPSRDDPAQWPETKDVLAEVFRRKGRDEWAALFEGTDACVTPVLSMDEAPEYPHALARSAFVDVGGTVQPAPAPRFSATPADIPGAPPERGADTVEVLREWGFSAQDIGALGQRPSR